MKIKNKISLAFLITGLILTFIGASAMYLIAEESLEHRIYEHLNSTAQSRARHIETYLDEHKDMVEVQASSILLNNTLKRINDNTTNAQKHTEAMTAELNAILKSEGHFYELFVLNPKGKIVISTDEDRIGLDRSTDAYFLGGKEGGFIKDAYRSEATNRGIFAISAPILDKETKEFLGVIVVKCSLADLSEITTDSSGLGKTGEIYLINKYGFMISPSRFMEDTFLKQKVDTINANECLMTKDEGHIHLRDIFPDYRGVNVIGTHAYMSEMQWCLLAEIDEKEALAPLMKLKIVFVSILIFIPFIAWLIGSIISRRIAKPLDELRKGTEIIGQGNLDYKIEIESHDEIGQLAHSFNMMTADLKETTTSVNELNREIIEREKAEKLALEHAETLERFNSLAVGRELKMLELKQEVNSLLNELDREDKYQRESDTPGTPDFSSPADDDYTGNNKDGKS